MFDEHPDCYRGMSGGPLWCVREPEDENASPQDWTAELWGMVFMEDRSPSSGRLDLHCHGPLSIERITGLYG